MTAQAPEHPADLREYVRVLRSRKYEVLAVAAVAVAAALVFSFRATPIYEGEAKVLVRPVQNLTSTSVSLPQAPNLDTERELVLSERVAGEVHRSLHVATPVDTLLEHAEVAVVSDTEILVIGYDDPDPAGAARLANGFADAYVEFRTSQALDQFQAAAGAVQERINSIRDDLASLGKRIESQRDPALRDSLTSQRDTLIAQLGVLEQRLVDLQAAGTTLPSAAEVIQRAETPRAPISPKKVRDSVLGLFAGIVLGLGFAFLRERLDDRVKTRAELERWMGAPVIAAVPHISGWRKSEEAQLIVRADPRSPVSEAYRTLGTNVQYMASRQRMRVFMVTSSTGGEGKSTTSANLAVVLAQSGRRVMLISADLRKPRIHNFFGLRNDLGLANLLADGAVLSQAARDPGIPNLRVISAGFMPNDPAALLGGAHAARFVESLRETADFILIDSPPVLAVADASILAPIADGTIFVFDPERSSRSAMVQSRHQLENAGARIVGIVYNNFDPGQNPAHPYAYTYYHDYYGPDDGAGRGSGRRSSRPVGDREPTEGAAMPSWPRTETPASSR